MAPQVLEHAVSSPTGNDQAPAGGWSASPEARDVARCFVATLEREGRRVTAALCIGACWKGAIEADDIMQDTYVEAIVEHRRGTLQLRTMGAWLRVAAEHNLRDAIARVKVRRRAPRPGPGSTTSVHPSPAGVRVDPSQDGSAPSDRPERSELSGIVREEFGVLPDVYRQILDLAIVRGLPRAAISRVIGRSRGAVGLLETRALALLRRRVAERLPERPAVKSAAM